MLVILTTLARFLKVKYCNFLPSHCQVECHEGEFARFYTQYCVAALTQPALFDVSDDVRDVTSPSHGVSMPTLSIKAAKRAQLGRFVVKFGLFYNARVAHLFPSYHPHAVVVVLQMWAVVLVRLRSSIATVNATQRLLRTTTASFSS